MPRKTFTFEGRRIEVTAKTEAELIAKVALRQKELEEGKKKITKNMTVSAWFEEYANTYKCRSMTTDSFKAYVGRYGKWVKPIIGNMALKDVKPLHCKRVLNQLIGMSKSHNDKTTQMMRGLFETACDNSLLLDNPMKNIEVPDSVEGSHRQITDEERRLILQVAETNEYGLWVLVMLYCGLRPNETGQIKICHIDLKNKKLYVDGTKTKAAKRYVPLPSPLLQRLVEIQLSPFEYLFTQKTTGRPLTKTSRRGMWKNFKRDLQIAAGCRLFRNALVPPYPIADDLTPYCLRHTFCTDLQDAGVQINVAKELMGHTSIETTGRYYTHFTSTAFDTAAERINRFHSGPGVGDGVGATPVTVAK